MQKIDQDLATSMREGVVARTAVLRLLKNSLKNEQIKLGHELSEDEAIKVLHREAKQRRDAIEAYRAGGRQDLADSENHELEVITGYLPQQLSEAEITEIIDKVIAETNAKGPAELGVVIGAVMQRAEGRTDGATVARLVRQRL